MLALTTTHQPIRLETDDVRNMMRNIKVTTIYAKQRASVKWLLSKAYNNRVPEKLREPYYLDHGDQEQLKPQIVHALSNAELYCLALANIYSDPNYHNQNHTGILQALARKGVFVTESNSTPLTETILIQNSPVKMMLLYDFY
ncbi:PREDICTED: patronin-like [Ceratosolen solmsi marchali]|uniref:Patronin-like n=1 Tax=Ceratosolen solmsi marchali TaxID=326594 RepID=A0AAJ6YN77_9HYME|nr:PREDICTED: patronin-like [Ceratosolen solmsi marchali]